MKKFIGFLCILSAIIITAVLSLHYVPIFLDYKKSADLYDEIRKERTSDEEGFESVQSLFLEMNHTDSTYAPIDVDSEKLFEQNSDYLGWIYVPGTSISYPVVKSTDNDDYLHTDFNGQYSFPGTVFMDCRCINGVLDHHSILYGHNMNNGTMFADLKSFREQKYLEDHPVFWFITPKYKLLYKVFSVCNVDPYDSTQYGTEYKSNEEFGKSMESIKKQSIVKTDIEEIENTAFVMSLSTCTGNDAVRCIVHGVLAGSIVN